MDLIATIRDPVAGLLATDSLPDLVVVESREYERGVEVAPGHPMAAAELAAVMVGEAIPRSPDGVAGARFFELDVAGFEERTWIMLFDFRHDDGESAIEGRGEFVDETRMLQPPVGDPRRFIEQTRLREPGDDFAVQCERFLRQFPDLGGWPPDRRVTRS
ncbi:hypothetical protein [Actinomadura chokoriensis]|uniref:hypothetical protein n=1 Tax=Actinomadura chokoriensis TaxID=454156 RepID=UPI0031F93A8E